MIDPHKILVKPVISELSTELREKENKYVFHVVGTANKIEIKKAVEALFNVKVVKVTSMNVKGKIKTRGRSSGKRPDWKKAFVTLRKCDKIAVIENM